MNPPMCEGTGCPWTLVPTTQPSTSLNPTSEPTVAPTLNPTTQQPTSCKERVMDLEARLAISTTQPPTFASTPNLTPVPTSNPTANLCKKDLEGCLAAGRQGDNESFSETVANFEARLEVGKKTHAGCLAGRKKDNDSFNESVVGFEARLSGAAETQCNDEEARARFFYKGSINVDGEQGLPGLPAPSIQYIKELAFGTCRCNELSVLRTEIGCDDMPDMPVDCVNGYVRYSKRLCEDACDGQCCVGHMACYNFNGYIYRDGKSCIGPSACQDSTIKEVKGSSCVGSSACRQVTSSLVADSCNGTSVCRWSEVGLFERSCIGEEARGPCENSRGRGFRDTHRFVD